MKTKHLISIIAVAIFLAAISFNSSSDLKNELFYSLSLVGVLFAHKLLSESITNNHTNDEHRAKI